MNSRLKFNQLVKRIKKGSWYYQGAAFMGLTGSYPMGACLDFSIFHKKLEFGFPFIGYMTRDFVRWWLDRLDMSRVANYYIARELRSPGWVERLFKNWLLIVNKLTKIQARLIKKNLSKLSNEELLAELSEFTNTYSYEWSEGIFIDAFDSEGERILRQAIEKYKGSITDGELHTLTSPSIPSSLQKQRFDLLKIAKLVVKNPQARLLVKQGRMRGWANFSPSQFNRLKKHQAEFYWIRGNYVVIPDLDINFFFSSLRELIVDKEHFGKEVTEERRMREMASVQRKIVSGLRFPKKILVTLDFLRTLVTWRDLRKKYNIMANYLLINKLLPELARRTGLPKNHLKHIYHTEYGMALKNPSALQKVLAARYKGRFLEFQPNYKYDEYFGKSGRRLLRLVEKTARAAHNEIKGLAAYPGVVKGRVKIILSSSDFHKMKKGDILVAPNTRPEYVPIMKLASAILSDEGGITSHTAIVAREYHIPCVVGCQIATIELRDGDKVEVDANNSIVKLIK